MCAALFSIAISVVDSELVVLAIHTAFVLPVLDCCCKDFVAFTINDVREVGALKVQHALVRKNY
jgi:hypothetical protein